MSLIPTFDDKISSYSKDEDFFNFLRAASTGNLQILADFITRRPEDINKAEDIIAASATHFAAKFNQLEALELLVNHGAILGRATLKGLNELHYGVRSVEIVELVLSQNPQLIESKNKDGVSALDCAIYYESLESADLLRRKMLEISTEKQFASQVAQDHADEIVAAVTSLEPSNHVSSRYFSPIKDLFQRTATQGK